MATNWKIESGICVGRGFSQQDPDGFLAKLTSFMKRPPNYGEQKTFTADPGTSNLTCASHGFNTGDSIIFDTTDTLPNPLQKSSPETKYEYFVIKVNDDTFRVASTYYNSKQGTAISITTTGSGTHYVQLMGGGAGWYVIDDLSNTTPKTFLPADVNISTEEITIANHGLGKCCLCTFSSTGSLPGGLSAGSYYYIIRVDDNKIKVASSYSNAYNESAINLTSTGSGTHTLQPTYPSIVFCDVPDPAPNEIDTGPSGGPPKFLRAEMPTNAAGEVRIRFAMYHDKTTHFTRGYWAGYRINTLDSSEFLYNFRGGAEGVMIFDFTSTNWVGCIWTEFVGLANHLEGPDVYGILQNNVSAGSNVVLQLGPGQAAKFTEGNYYYIIDMTSGGRKVKYVNVINVNVGNDQITVNNLQYDYNASSIIGAYPHRWIAMGQRGSNNLDNINYEYSSTISRSKLPYCSVKSDNNCFHNQTGIIYAYANSFSCTSLLSCENPNDLGLKAVIRPLFFEYYTENAQSTSDMNRIIGVAKNCYVTAKGSWTGGIHGLEIGGKKYLYFVTTYDIMNNGVSDYALLVLDSESSV